MGRERGGQEMTERTLLNVVSKCPFSFFSFLFLPPGSYYASRVPYSCPFDITCAS